MILSRGDSSLYSFTSSPPSRCISFLPRLKSRLTNVLPLLGLRILLICQLAQGPHARFPVIRIFHQFINSYIFTLPNSISMAAIALLEQAQIYSCQTDSRTPSPLCSASICYIFGFQVWKPASLNNCNTPRHTRNRDFISRHALLFPRYLGRLNRSLESLLVLH